MGRVGYTSPLVGTHHPGPCIVLEQPAQGLTHSRVRTISVLSRDTRTFLSQVPRAPGAPRPICSCSLSPSSTTRLALPPSPDQR